MRAESLSRHHPTVDSPVGIFTRTQAPSSKLLCPPVPKVHGLSFSVHLCLTPSPQLPHGSCRSIREVSTEWQAWRARSRGNMTLERKPPASSPDISGG